MSEPTGIVTTGFLILNDAEVYHIGASLKDLGKKMFAFSKLELSVETIKKYLMNMEQDNLISNRERIGKRIAELRKARGISQARLAQLTKLDSGYIGKIEKGRFDIGIDNLCRIGEVLGCRIDFIDEKTIYA